MCLHMVSALSVIPRCLALLPYGGESRTWLRHEAKTPKQGGSGSDGNGHVVFERWEGNPCTALGEHEVIGSLI